MPEKASLLCMRLADMARVHPLMSRAYKCDRCGHQLGIYPSGQEHIRQYGRDHIELICNQCTNRQPDIVQMTTQNIIECAESVDNPENSNDN